MEGEEKRYLNGRTSSFAVLELQDKLFNAQVRELSARLDLARALEEFRAARGVLLRERGFLLKGEVQAEQTGLNIAEPASATETESLDSSGRLLEIRKRLEDFRSRS